MTDGKRMTREQNSTPQAQADGKVEGDDKSAPARVEPSAAEAFAMDCEGYALAAPNSTAQPEDRGGVINVGSGNGADRKPDLSSLLTQEEYENFCREWEELMQYRNLEFDILRAGRDLQAQEPISTKLMNSTPQENKTTQLLGKYRAPATTREEKAILELARTADSGSDRYSDRALSNEPARVELNAAGQEEPKEHTEKPKGKPTDTAPAPAASSSPDALAVSEEAVNIAERCVNKKWHPYDQLGVMARELLRLAAARAAVVADAERYRWIRAHRPCVSGDPDYQRACIYIVLDEEANSKWISETPNLDAAIDSARRK